MALGATLSSGIETHKPALPLKFLGSRTFQCAQSKPPS
jgi:hypothetical protein